MARDKVLKKIKLVPKQLVVYGDGNDFPSTFEWSEMNESWGWSVHVSISFNMKGEVRTKFQVNPSLLLPSKKRKELIFKTDSYVELKKWLKKHKTLIEKPINEI